MPKSFRRFFLQKEAFYVLECGLGTCVELAALRMIIALEGAPGVGKSTIAAALGAGGAGIIPEVNRLFARPDPEPAGWYCERQVARWAMAQLHVAAGDLAVLDGDPFQPLWFAWIYHADGWPQDPAAFGFFRRRIARGEMGLPGLYVFAHCPEPVRCERMMAREVSRGIAVESAREKVARYGRMVEPQRRFFAALGRRFPGLVLDLETSSVPNSIAAIRGAVAAAPPVEGREAFRFIERWLAANVA
jgi:hypothetical protein